MLSWEYPPRVVGGIARHVRDLAHGLVAQGVKVTVVTPAAEGAPSYEKEGLLSVCRVPSGHPRAMDFTGRVMQLNFDFLQETLALVYSGERFDLVHAHDWVTAYAARAIKHGLGLPLFATIHATEWGRNNGLHNDLQRHISDLEWWLCYEAWRVICCSHHMRGELVHVFQLPADKIRLIPNGVYPAEFVTPPVPAGFRERYAAPDERIVFHVGRLVREKGVDVLLEAFARLLARFPQAKLVVAGRGPHEEALHEHARRLGIYQRVYFTGYIDDTTRNLLYHLADAVVFPSLYEPFGIVALEAMAAGAPLLVADTGGLGEIVVHGRNGLKARSGAPVSLAENLLWMLENPARTAGMRRQAREDVRNFYDWEKIALRTVEAYEEVLTEQARIRPDGIPARSFSRMDREGGWPDRYREAIG
ncbi:MAG: glycosyltransferase family 4 protein [Firmicutes bacterium]|nr:glycosyltransferase family 4 protein [Bacillota bacterium]